MSPRTQYKCMSVSSLVFARPHAMPHAQYTYRMVVFELILEGRSVSPAEEQLVMISPPTEDVLQDEFCATATPHSMESRKMIGTRIPTVCRLNSMGTQPCATHHNQKTVTQGSKAGSNQEARLLIYSSSSHFNRPPLSPVKNGRDWLARLRKSIIGYHVQLPHPSTPTYSV